MRDLNRRFVVIAGVAQPKGEIEALVLSVDGSAVNASVLEEFLALGGCNELHVVGS